jgi:hypothetical protein
MEEGTVAVHALANHYKIRMMNCIDMKHPCRLRGRYDAKKVTPKEGSSEVDMRRATTSEAGIWSYDCQERSYTSITLPLQRPMYHWMPCIPKPFQNLFLVGAQDSSATCPTHGLKHPLFFQQEKLLINEVLPLYSEWWTLYVFLE